MKTLGYVVKNKQLNSFKRAISESEGIEKQVHIPKNILSFGEALAKAQVGRFLLVTLTFLLEWGKKLLCDKTWYSAQKLQLGFFRDIAGY